MCVGVCVCVCVRACVRVCVSMCVCVSKCVGEVPIQGSLCDTLVVRCAYWTSVVN